MTQLKQLLTDAAERARVYPVVEVARTRGRRRRRRLRMLATGGGAVAVVAAMTAVGISINAGWSRHETAAATNPVVPTEPSASPPAGPALPTSCTSQVLPVPAGYPSKAVVTGGDPTGRFILGRAYPGDGRPRILIWDDGVVTAVAMPGSDPSLLDINSSGTAVGSSWLTDETEAAFVYQDGQMTRLPGDNARAYSINESGMILGLVNTGPGQARSVVWRTPASEPELLTGDDYFFAGTEFGQLRDDGSVIGQISGSQAPGFFWGDTQPAIWHPDGTITPLQWPQLSGPTPDYIMMIGSTGDWMTVRTEGSDWLRVYGWNIETGEVRAFDGDLRVVNSRGWAVGMAVRGTLLSSGEESVVISPPSADMISLSDDGRTITGYGIGGPEGADNTPFVWHCS